MKQIISSYLTKIEPELIYLNKYLYDNPEFCFHEYKSYSLIISMLKKYNFKITEHAGNIETAFIAQYGKSHPHIGILCKYSSGNNYEDGHVYGNNANATISIGASIALSEVLDKTGGSVILIGCPGKYSNGCELIHTKNNIFDDIDILIAPHVDIGNYKSGTSLCSIPLTIEYSHKTPVNFCENYTMSSIAPTLNLLWLIDSVCNCNKECYIDNLKIEANSNIHDLNHNSSISFEIKSSKYETAELLEKTLKNLLNSISSEICINCKVHLNEIPSKELISNKCLSRIFSNNLKECGIIHIDDDKNVLYPLGIGNISRLIPTIYPSISIVDSHNDSNKISCPSTTFRDCTITNSATTNILKGCKAIAFTALDFIQSDCLLNECLAELHHKK